MYTGPLSDKLTEDFIHNGVGLDSGSESENTTLWIRILQGDQHRSNVDSVSDAQTSPSHRCQINSFCQHRKGWSSTGKITSNDEEFEDSAARSGTVDYQRKPRRSNRVSKAVRFVPHRDHSPMLCLRL
mmetsp:Transcript_9087/g.22282  ORF Transcript_9087/g.22282 Transcript_9087/m.22282 type:complete len:128 (-) Transcript_9087:248-631(-)